LTFYFAARFLGRRLRTAVTLLYTWCRFCDDAIDADDQGPPAAKRSPAERALILDELRRSTWAALHLHPRRLAAYKTPPALAAFAALAVRYNIPDHYPQELLAGMEMDLNGHVYRTLGDVRLYGYRVAGTVGLMFCHVAGVSDPRALRHAADLGTAMQLTNIARDVREDFAMGRVYLPEEWLAAEGLTAADVGSPEHGAAVARVVGRLLAKADELYRSGDEGLQYLPLAAAFAVAAARHIYAGIGTLVARRGAAAWDSRAVVPFTGKLRLAGRGILQVLRLAGGRWRAPFQPAPLNTIWRCP
jgi:phytoene synthase